MYVEIYRQLYSTVA